MIKKQFDHLVAILAQQSAECAKLSLRADADQDERGKHFQEGARMALNRALEYVKDAQAGILKP